MVSEKEKLIQQIENCSSSLYIRYGFGWKGATWNRTTKENLIAVLNAGKYAHYDLCSVNNGLGISFYSANDML